MTDSAATSPPQRPEDRDHALARRRALYWRRTLRLTAGLLLVWMGVTLVFGLWLPGQDWSLLGWPVGYWAASQGALLMYCALVWLYCVLMDRLEASIESGAQD